VLGVLLVFVILKAGILGHVYDIRTSREGIEFLFLSRFVVSTISYCDIEEVIEPVAGGFLHLTALNYRNRAGTGCFLIRKKHSWFAKSLVVTPANSDSFVRSLKDAGVPVLRKQSVAV
jgi:hypothetical protein